MLIEELHCRAISAVDVRKQAIRGLLFCLLTLILPCRGITQIKVANAGFPGENSKEIAARLDGALKKYRPRFVVIFVGMNDAVNDRKFLTPQQTSEFVTRMVKTSKDDHAAVVLVNLHEPDEKRLLQRHTRESYGDLSPAARVDAVNRELMKIAQIYGASFANFHEALEKAGGADDAMSTDGVHLTANGYHLLASTIREALPQHITEDTTVLCIGDSLTYGIGVRQPGDAPEGDETYPAQLRSLLR